jgi:Nucleotidyl transferase
MQPITLDRPKPMVPVLGKPFLAYQIEQLCAMGFKKVLLLLGYLPQSVIDYFGDGKGFGIQIEYSVTGPDDLTSSRVSNARHLIDPCFMLLYCDNYLPIRMDNLWQQFCAAGKPAMIVVYPNRDGYSRDNVKIEPDNTVTVFDRTRSAQGLRGVEISYAVLTDLTLGGKRAGDALDRYMRHACVNHLNAPGRPVSGGPRGAPAWPVRPASRTALSSMILDTRPETSLSERRRSSRPSRSAASLAQS